MMSNRLSHLRHEAAEQYRRHKGANADAIDAYLKCGHALIEAKAACKHGEWLPWLKASEVPKRTAQRMSQLAESGLKNDTVTHLGGIGSALQFCAWYKGRFQECPGAWAKFVGPESIPDEEKRDHIPPAIPPAVWLDRITLAQCAFGFAPEPEFAAGLFGFEGPPEWPVRHVTFETCEQCKDTIADYLNEALGIAIAGNLFVALMPTADSKDYRKTAPLSVVGMVSRIIHGGLPNHDCTEQWRFGAMLNLAQPLSAAA